PPRRPGRAAPPPPPQKQRTLIGSIVQNAASWSSATARATDDRYDLPSFVAAQEPLFDRVRAELAAGRKESHWMWFVFPQLQGLGSSATARHYATAFQEEARAYLAHAVRGPRLRGCTGRVNPIEGRRVDAIFGYSDQP